MRIEGPTPAEEDVLARTAELWNALNALPEENTDEKHDLRFHLHAIQDIIAARCTFRHYKRARAT